MANRDKERDRAGQTRAALAVNTEFSAALWP